MFAARLTIQHDMSRPAPVTRCFCSGAANVSGANAAFAQELQMRIASAEAASQQVSSRSQRLAGITPGALPSQRGQNRWGISRLIAAVAAAFVSGLLSNNMVSHNPTPAIQEAQVYPGLPQHQVQQPCSLPQLPPAALRLCLHWLQDRKALLRSELVALQLLPPACCESPRQEEIIADLQGNEVMVTALKASSQEQV